MAPDPDLFTARKLAGQWWLPETPNQRIGGILTYDPAEGLQLDLHGTLIAIQPGPNGTRHNPIRILGQTTDGTVTLHKCMRAGYSLQMMAGFSTSRYVAQVAFVGDHLDYANEPRFADVGFSFTGLDEWLNREIGSHEFVEDGETISLSREEDVTVDVPAIQANMVVSSWRSGPSWPAHTSIEVRGGTSIHIRPTGGPQSWSFFEKTAFQIQNMLSLLGGGPAVVDRCVSWDPEHPGAGLVILDAPRRSSRPALPNRFFMPYTPGQGPPDFGECLRRWMAMQEQVKEVTDLLSVLHRESRLLLNVRFQFLVQALESYHRQRHPGTYMPDDQYEGVKQSLAVAIPNNVTESHRAALRSRIRFGNEYSLMRRLEGLWNLLPAPSQNRISTDPDTFLRRVKETRDYFAHFDPTIPHMTNQEIASALPRLEAFATAMVALELGFNPLQVMRVVDQTLG